MRGYHGLCIEMKATGEKPKKDKHSKEQEEVLKKLYAMGYLSFVIYGYQNAVDTIDWYMGMGNISYKHKYLC
jgi:archaellum component FlaD/FlaE